MVIDEFIENKYGSDSPGSSRFQNDPTEIHASQVSDCQRKRKWKHERNPDTDPSVYFELGRMYERLYGRALRSVYDEDVILQDVNIEIEFEEFSIVGEADWCILSDPYPNADLKYVRKPDGSIVEIRGDGRVVEDEDEHLVERVIETKTTSDLKWKRMYGVDESHRYQCAVYMMAMGCPGEVVYMTRDRADEMSIEIERSPELFLDIEMRAQKHFDNMTSEVLPPTSPMSDKECKYCDFKNECKSKGGSVWE